MKKALLWVRTSTDKQEIDSMTDDLKRFAVSYGYTEFTVVGARGASAIKADELYREEMDRLYTELGTGQYDCLFAWEMSRLGRIEEYVIRLKNYLISHRIQLRVQNPQLYLLEEDGSVNMGMELAITLMLTLAKQEMTVKMERMLRGRKRNQREGKFSGAPSLKFGYCLDDEGFIRIDPINGDIVREMYDMFINRHMSSSAIYKYYNERGILRDYNNSTSGAGVVVRMLKDMAYCGKPDRGNKYPAIVTEETVQKAIERAAMNRIEPKYLSKHVYYCKGNIICEECGHVMIPMSNNAVYRCCKWGHERGVSINVCDYIAWEMVKKYRPVVDRIRRKRAMTEYQKQRKSEQTAISGLEKKLSKCDEKLERLNDLFITGYITKQNFENKASAIASERMKISDSITEHTEKLNAVERLIQGSWSDDFNLIEINNDEMRQKYVRETLVLRVIKIAKSHYNISVLPLVPTMSYDWFDYIVAGHIIKLIHHEKFGDTETTEDWTGLWPVRFKRIR